MSYEGGVMHLEYDSYLSPLDEQVRLLPREKKSQLGALLDIGDDLSQKGIVEAGLYCIDLTEGDVRDQVQYNLPTKSFLLNAKPVTVLQIIKKMEEVGYDFIYNKNIFYFDDDLSKRAHIDYKNTAAAWTLEASYNLNNNSLRFMHDVHEVERLSSESNQDLTALGAKEMKDGFFMKMRENALAVADSVSDELEPERVMQLLKDVFTFTKDEDLEVSEEYVKHVYPKFIEFIKHKYFELKNKGGNIYEQLIAGITSIAEFAHRDISELIMELQELDLRQIEEERRREAMRLEAELKKTWFRKKIEKVQRNIYDFNERRKRYIVFEKPGWND